MAVIVPPHRESLDGLDLEMQGDETEDKRFEVLNEVVKDPEAFGVGRLGHVDEGSDFGRLGLSASVPIELAQAQISYLE